MSIELSVEQLDSIKFLITNELWKRGIPVQQLELSYVGGNLYMQTEAFRTSPPVFKYHTVEAIQGEVTQVIYQGVDSIQIKMPMMVNNHDYIGAVYPKPYMTFLCIMPSDSSTPFMKVFNDD